jgi:alkanesulfonate monooxygenase SsuD/methylene tetrahydromethanopterin reductase-like flavin-dependent oxidoreductase (luciferase family)
VTLRDTAAARAIIDLYKAEWRKLGRAEADLPLMGINRHIVIADTEAEARESARRAYPRWRGNMERLWAQYNVPFPLGASLPLEWDALQEHGHAIAGTPAQVRDYITEAVEASSASYFVCDFAFGAMTHAEAMRSTELFASEIMPAFAAPHA